MLVKLAFVMQRLKKYLKKIFVMIDKDGGGDNFWILWGDTAVMRGGIELMGGPPQSPPHQGKPWIIITACSFLGFSSKLKTMLRVKQLNGTD